MGAFHFTAKVISRSGGAKSVVRAAAYRAAERLKDERLGVVEDYTRKRDVIDAAILVPKGAPEWASDRQDLWNRVEAHEKRRDSQLAQEFEINLPRELSDEENWRLLTDFVRAELVDRGRVCDVAFHKHVAADGAAHPHAHCMMPMRYAEGESFGKKHPDVDRATFFQNKNRIAELRASWCEFSRVRAGELGVDLGPEWDHRSFVDRGVDQEAQPKRGATADRMEAQGNATARAAEVLAAQRRNGERLLQDPGQALTALTGQQSTFTDHDLARWIHRHSDDEQFQAIYSAAKGLAVELGPDAKGQIRYSTREMVALERQMLEDASSMAQRQAHQVRGAIVDRTLEASQLSEEQQIAARAIVAGGDLTCLLGLAGTGKSTMLSEVRRAYEAQGFTVQGASLSGIAAQSLQEGSGITATTLASLAGSWSRERKLLTDKDVLVIDEAGMVGSRQLAHVLEHAQKAGAKVVLVGDPEQLQAIEAGAAFRAIVDRTGAAELTEVRRQQEAWQRLATKELATGATGAALDRYQAAGGVHVAASDEAAKAALVARWAAAQEAAPDKSRIMLAHTRADVQGLNAQARESQRAAGALGEVDVSFATSRGERAFATGDRFLFLRNERELGVKNGTLGTVEDAGEGRLAVRTDDGRRIAVDPETYRDFDHGYAMTIHKAQGVTVDQAFVLATGGYDRHLAYVAMSRHRETLQVVYSGQEFSSTDKLKATLGRERAKDVTVDYTDERAVLAAAREVLQPERPMTDKERARAALMAKGRAANAERVRTLPEERTHSRENDLEL